MVVTAIVGFVLIGAVASYLRSQDSMRGIASTVGDCSLLVAVVFGAIMCTRAANRRTSERRAWRLMTLAFLCWTFGAALTLFYGLTRNHVYPHPSIADLGFLSYSIPTLAALLAFPRPPALPISRLRAALDAVVIASGVMFLSAATVVDFVVHSLDRFGPSALVMVAYPIVDVVICSVVLALGMRQPPGQRLTWLLLGGGIVTLAVTDGVYFALTALRGNVQTGGPLVVGWLAAALLIVLATLAPKRYTDLPPTRRFVKAVELIPYLPILAGAIAIAVHGLHRHAFIMGIGAVLVAAVAARQIMIVFENVTLTENLEKKVGELDGLGSIVTSSRDAIIGVSLAGQIVSANPAAVQLFGYTADELAESPGIICGDGQQRIHQLIERARHGEDIPKYEWDWLRPDGSTVRIELAVSPIGHGSSFQGISVSAQDVTARDLVTAALEEAREDALEASRLKSEFLATMSHEIRTPMNGVLGLTSLLLDTHLDQVQRQYAEGVHAAGDALLVVINDILDFSKLEAGKVELDPDEFEVRKLVDEVAALVAPPAFDKGLELLVQCRPDVPDWLVGDGHRIRQILLNLASNAVKFTGAGEVAIAVTAAPADHGSVSVHFAVSDTGIGIAEDSRELLFTSFSQGDASTTRQYGGTGLGLAISARLVEAMGGRIGFDSRLGHGSTFWCELPLELGGGGAESGQFDPSPLRGLHVLVVDGNATSRHILSTQLSSWGLLVDVVPNAATALRQLRSQVSQGQAYDIAVLDLGLPDMNGVELARVISADAGLHPTRLIVMTSKPYLSLGVRDQVGIADWLTKPVRSSELFNRLLRPAVPQPSLAPGAPRAVRPAGSPPCRLGRILVVEDNALNQLVAEGILARLGYQVDLVANGALALQALGSTVYSAVLMDCHMPVMDGFAATREIRRRDDANRSIPIIAMTAGALPADRERCLASGMDDFVAKPVDLQLISDVLRKWVTADEHEGETERTSQSVPGLRGSPTW